MPTLSVDLYFDSSVLFFGSGHALTGDLLNILALEESFLAEC